MEQSMERRDFIRNALVTGGALSVPGGLMAHTLSISEELTTASDELLKGVSDIHVHALLDSQLRSISELSFARQAHKAGYRSVMYKSNDFSSHDRAFLIHEILPDFEVFGSLVMNKTHGDKVNVHAAEKAVATSGNRCRCIWMPTQDATYHLRENNNEQGIAVLDRLGKVLPEVIRVMEICAEADIVFATGHSSPEESITMARKAREIGVRKFVITHVNSLMWTMKEDQIKQAIELGAFVEYCLLPCFWGAGTSLPDFPVMSMDEFASFVRINPERSFITNDMGQTNIINPIEAMRKTIPALLTKGISQESINLMVRRNPTMLMGLKG